VTYAGARRILDADSHLMELADFLDDHIADEYRDSLRRAGMEALEPVLAAAVNQADRRRAERRAGREQRQQQEQQARDCCVARCVVSGHDGAFFGAAT